MKTIKELEDIRAVMKRKIALRKGSDFDGAFEGKVHAHVLICGGTGCTASGSVPLQTRLEQEIELQGLG